MRQLQRLTGLGRGLIQRLWPQVLGRRLTCPPGDRNLSLVTCQGKGNRELRIFNAGQVTARNVKVEWLNCREDDGIYVTEEFSDLGDMSPQNPWKVRLFLNSGHEPKMHLRYTWSDDNKEFNEFEEFLQV